MNHFETWEAVQNIYTLAESTVNKDVFLSTQLIKVQSQNTIATGTMSSRLLQVDNLTVNVNVNVTTDQSDHMQDSCQGRFSSHIHTIPFFQEMNSKRIKY